MIRSSIELGTVHVESIECDALYAQATEEKRQPRRISKIDTATDEAPPAPHSRSLWSFFQRSPPNPTLSLAVVRWEACVCVLKVLECIWVVK